ncbi:MAG: 50S ribosomal protein L37e [DPANN group archaeon]|nr:50S ribosomal protein L37e [DPANN group archaeon]
MTKGKPSFGKRNKTVHTNCRRCGNHSYHKTDKECSACGFGKSPSIIQHAWQNKHSIGMVRKS